MQCRHGVPSGTRPQTHGAMHSAVVGHQADFGRARRSGSPNCLGGGAPCHVHAESDMPRGRGPTPLLAVCPARIVGCVENAIATRFTYQDN